MKRISWEECVSSNFIIKVRSDKERMVELKNHALERYSFWSNQDNKHITLKVEAYYEIIKELILAFMYKKGFTSKNHICLIAFAKKFIDNFDYEINKIAELKKIRNEIVYRGLKVQNKYLEMNEPEFRHIIKKLKSLIL